MIKIDFIKHKIIECLEINGIFIDSINEDFDLRQYIIDSMQFIGTIVTIEDELKIEIPPVYLHYDNLASFTAFCILIESLFEEIKT